METTAVIDLNQYKLDTTFYQNHLVHTVFPVNCHYAQVGWHLGPFKQTWKQVKQIGEGGFGSVWLEKEVSTRELRAVKKIYREKSRNVNRELCALVKMRSHRDLFVQFLGWYEDDRGFIFIAMEYHGSGDLGQYLKTFRSKARSEVKEITGQLLKGLVVLHQNHIYHRDLKPNNVLIACHSPIRVKLSDFGTSKSTVNTFLRTRCGTSGYMAPELLGLVPQGRGPYTTALDIWSLGCVIYEILTSETPFLEKVVDTAADESFTHDAPDIDMHLFLQFCLGNIDLPVEYLQASGASEDAVNFLRKLLVANPTSRISAVDALDSRWLFESPDELDQKNSSNVLREHFRSLGLEFNASAMDSLITQYKEHRNVDISEVLVDSDIRRLPSLVPVAVKMGHTLVVELLLQATEHLYTGSRNLIDYTTGNYLRSAAECGHLGIVKLLLERGTDVNATKYWDKTVLHGAAKNGNLEVVKLLLENGADANIIGNCGWTALHVAVMNGHPKVVRLLFENGADANITGDWGWTALHEAAMNGHIEIVRLLLENSADTNIKDGWGWTALHRAAKYGHLEIVRLLLENGSDANMTGSWGASLHGAANYGHLEIVRLLFENGADANIKDGWGWTALHRAAKYGHLEVVRLLLENSADINITGGWGWTAFHEAAMNGHLEVVRMLLENGVDANMTGSWGAALHGAANYGHLEVVKLLFENGTDANIKDGWGWTALHRAAKYGHLEVVRLLLENSADINITGGWGWTAFHEAVMNGHLEVVRLLSENGADASITDGWGLTALHEAAKYGNLEIVRLLFENGVDANIGSH